MVLTQAEADVLLQMPKEFDSQDAQGMAYLAFHFRLLLDGYAVEEFNRAWIAEALGNWKLTDALAKSADHIALVRTDEQLSPRYIFRKTPFVLARLAALPEENRKRAEVAEIEAKRCEEESKRLAAEAAARRIRLYEVRNADEPFYTITLAPGLVRYLEVAVFLEADIERWIALLREASAQPKIQTSREDVYGERYFASGLNLTEVDRFFPCADWEQRLRTHHALGRLWVEHEIPSRVYCFFHRELRLSALELDECRNAWVKEAWDDEDVTESFVGESNHLVVGRGVFRMTRFVADRIAALKQEADLEEKRRRESEDAKKAFEEMERLRKSHFSTFVYLMEDLRNGHFKIGRSATPARRERTLQSEVPQIVLRFSIPADENHERELHEHFTDKRLRGEWFALSSDDLVWLVSFLKRNGDVARASVDHQWLGLTFINASDDSDAK